MSQCPVNKTQANFSGASSSSASSHGTTFQPSLYCRKTTQQALHQRQWLHINSAFPPYLWNLLLLQAELTLNLLRQATLKPQISEWDFFKGPFNFNKMPLGPAGCRVLIHTNPASCWSWDFRAKNGFYIGPALESYPCFKLVNADTKSQVISNMVKSRHSYLSVPAPSTEDQIIYGLQVFAIVLAGAAPPTSIF
jgi:hypothetical protein